MSNWQDPRKCAQADCETVFKPTDPRGKYCSKHHWQAIGQMIEAMQKGEDIETAVSRVLADSAAVGRNGEG